MPTPMSQDDSAFVPHPRFGQTPRLTGLDPHATGYAYFGWQKEGLIPGTAIPADITKQRGTCMPRTHYLDRRRTCVDCGKPFIFYAEEQRHWYETLGFPVDADCTRCPICRKETQALDRARRRYEALCHAGPLSADECLEMAELCLGLVERGTFSPKQVPHIRALLHQAAAQAAPATEIERLTTRLNAFATAKGGPAARDISLP